jgi:hypothetical protein
MATTGPGPTAKHRKETAEQKAQDAYNAAVVRIEDEFAALILKYLDVYARQVAELGKQLLRAAELAARARDDSLKPVEAVYLRAVRDADQLGEKIMEPARRAAEEAFQRAKQVYDEGSGFALQVRNAALADATKALDQATYSAATLTQ